MWGGAVEPGWLVIGVLLHLGNQVARGYGWCTLLRSATGTHVRRSDAIGAWVAGAGAGGLASARAGDALRVLLLRRRLPEAGCPLLAGTLVAEGAGELAVGVALISVALLVGVGPAIQRPGRDRAPRRAGRSDRARPRGRARAAPARHRPRRRPRMRAAQAARRLRARGAPVAGREPGLPARRARLLPRRVRPPGQRSRPCCWSCSRRPAAGWCPLRPPPWPRARRCSPPPSSP